MVAIVSIIILRNACSALAELVRADSATWSISSCKNSSDGSSVEVKRYSFMLIFLTCLFDANVDKIQFPNKFSAIKFTAFQYFPDLRAFAGRWDYYTGSK